MSKIQIEIYISSLHSEYVELPHSVRALLLLKNLTKEGIDNWGIDSEKLKFVSSTLSMRILTEPYFWQQIKG